MFFIVVCNEQIMCEKKDVCELCKETTAILSVYPLD